MISRLRPKLQQPLLVLARPFMKINPNFISLLGTVSSVLFLLLLMEKRYYWSFLAFAGVLLDSIDGIVARETKKVTPFGGFFDSSLDRISDSILIISFGFAHLARWEIVSLLLIVSFSISYLRARAESAGKGKIKLNIGLIQRAERLALVFIALGLYLIFPLKKLFGFNLTESIFILLIILSIITIFQRIHSAFLKLKK